MIRRMLVRALGLPEFKPDTGSYWLGDLGQIMSPSCASVSLGIHGTCPTSFKKQHPDRRKSKGVVTGKKLEAPLKRRVLL